MNEKYWEETAKRILEFEKVTRHYCNPEPQKVMVEYRKGNYIGYIQEIAQEYSKEIVLLSKSTKPLQKELVNAIKKLDSGWLDMCTDKLLELEGRLHVVRKLGNRLTIMTSEQIKYMAKHPQIIPEISSNNLEKLCKIQLSEVTI